MSKDTQQVAIALDRLRYHADAVEIAVTDLRIAIAGREDGETIRAALDDYTAALRRALAFATDDREGGQ